MNEKALKTLEYIKIRDRLSALALSPMGKEKCDELVPMHDIDAITREQKETTEAVNMSLKKGRLPLGGIKDIRTQLGRAEAGGVLGIEELMAVGDFLYVCRKVKNYAKQENKADVFPVLEDYFEIVKTITNLEKEISRCIVNEQEISDDASSGLRTVRREIRNANGSIRDKLNTIIYSAAYKNMLQDAVITIRNDRYCVPVRSEYQSSFPGMVHDRSNTGSTVFMEPTAVIQLNNKIKELQAKEKEEIEKILAMLSAMVAENVDVIEANINVIAHLDFIFAKSELSLKMNGAEPIFNTNGIIDIRKGRHPLLDEKKVVPIDINLGKDFNTLLITGPNTGGKTVALKTLGLFTLMGQAGLHIPAFDSSQLAVFDDVFADIGDEQSIEQSLSTFSAHMTNTVSIINSVTPNCLVLFDELGAGTDPTEGAALAMAIIQLLHKMNVRTAVTTHYSELKVYALSTEGVENACCEFDVETLRPTYRLLIGIPGKSNAFAISKKLGLPDYVIDSAKEFISSENVKFEDVITDLEISKKTVVYEQERAEQFRKEAERLKNEVEKQRAKINDQREKILADARNEARMVYQQAKEESDRIIKEMNKAMREKSANQNKMNEKRSELKSKVAKMDEAISKAQKKKVAAVKPIQNLKAGDNVYVVSFDKTGVALSAPDSNGDVMVQTGNMKLKVPLNELTYYEPKKEPKSNASRNISTKVRAGKSQYIASEIDCRGQNVEEGLGNIDKYLDDAFLAGLKTVTIIHGKGTGVLRAAVQKYLRTNPHVRTFRPGVYGEGEMGVTIVELKNS
ncbi:endonuclease MutS2 [Anaerotignum sp. MSJ-24]|uniref:endonuclease MutS2 n=1 Tax=Anaerotignum sp. MSJ-24 TaxID=2841521 RepID=UPI001C107EE0|nr:endonuclease MutS2 [Anaerotignum sp. MSJ-24]MBU5464383.1 endonuclease MutS2 [Anaerotignum sp. MSJ-24]